MAPLLPARARQHRGPGRAMLIPLGLACLGIGYFLGVGTNAPVVKAAVVAGAGTKTVAAASEEQAEAAGKETGMLPHHDVVPDVVEGGAVGARQQDSTHDDVAPADGGGAISSGGTTAAAAALATTGGAAGTSFGADGVKTVCQDTCPGHANNGICEDGRPSIKSEAPPEEMAMFLVLCDLGTDCGDCGPWVHNNTDASDSWRPIEEIRAKNYTVMTRHTQHPSGFYMAFTDPAQDVDVSSQLANVALLEPGFTWVWNNLLREGCAPRGGGRPGLVLDVGANFGYYSLLAAAMGCRVVAWEPVPYFAAYFKYGLLINNFTHSVELRDAIVSNSSGGELTIQVPNRGIWGTAGIDGKNIDGAIANDGDYDKFTRKVERVDEVVKEDVLIMKVDVEGFEPSVLRGTRDLLLQHEVANIFMEYSPGVAERHRDWPWFVSNPIMLMGLLQAGYRIQHLAFMAQHFPDWEGTKELPEVEEVMSEVLKHDIWDAFRLQNHDLGCANRTAEEVLEAMEGVYMFTCRSQAIPEAIDPQSFRSTFGHNTNVWAFKQKPWFSKLNGTASLAPIDFDIQHEFFIPGGVFGAASRLCKDVEAHSQVMHRCPCLEESVCGEQEKKVREFAKAGMLPPFPMADDVVKPEEMGIETW